MENNVRFGLDHRLVQKFMWRAAVVLLAASTAGCQATTPPTDQTRESNVLEIIWGLRNVKGVYDEIPANYLNLEKRGFRAPLDPVFGKPYEYAHTGDMVTVCAIFEKASPAWDGFTNAAVYGDPVVHGYGSWVHGPGRQCLTKNISTGQH